MKRDLGLELARKQLEKGRKADNLEDVAAWIKFYQAVNIMRETALEVGVVIKKSPCSVAAETGAINQSQLQIYGKTSKRSANNRALPRQKPDVDGMLRDKASR